MVQECFSSNVGFVRNKRHSIDWQHEAVSIVWSVWTWSQFDHIRVADSAAISPICRRTSSDILMKKLKIINDRRVELKEVKKFNLTKQISSWSGNKSRTYFKIRVN